MSDIIDTFDEYEDPSFALKDVPGFPWETYEALNAKYKEAERWFTGAVLEDEGWVGEDTDLYPAKINPLIGLCMKHAQTLFGDVEDDARPLVRPKLVPKTKDNEQEKESIAACESGLFQIWHDNHGRGLMLENAILSQIYGGCIFKVYYSKTDKERPIRIEIVNPKGFIGIPKNGDQYRLSEAWQVKRISLREAQRLGYKGTDEAPWYIEHWTEKEQNIYINDQIASAQLNNGDKYAYSGNNEWGFVPFIYIPHLRIGAFIGLNTFDHLKGLIKELNLRHGDYGDAVNTDSHTTVAYRNTRGKPNFGALNDAIDGFDLGDAQGISGNEPDPDMWDLRGGSTKASAPMKTLLDELYKQFRRDAALPAVADGEDEGSQRSGLTIAMRFWPMTSHINMERVFWTTCLNVFTDYIISMAAKLSVAGIKTEHIPYRVMQKWAAPLPRDREADVQEWVQRAANNLGSIEHLLEMTGDIEDIPAERKNILQWVEDLATIEAEITAKMAQKYPPPVQPGAPGATSTGNKRTPKKDGNK